MSMCEKVKSLIRQNYENPIFGISIDINANDLTLEYTCSLESIFVSCYLTSMLQSAIFIMIAEYTQAPQSISYREIAQNERKCWWYDIKSDLIFI